MYSEDRLFQLCLIAADVVRRMSVKIFVLLFNKIHNLYKILRLVSAYKPAVHIDITDLL